MKLILLLIPLLLISGCVAIAPAPEISENAILAAEYRLDAAEEIGSSWINTESLIEQAKVARDSGDHKAAVEYARQARFEGEAAYEQNKKQQNAQPWQF